MRTHLFRNSSKGQAVIEIAIFGAILFFLVGMILRTHMSQSFGINHQVRAMKLALQQSYRSNLQNVPNSSRNSASVLFIEDRLSPDLNKFTTIDRNPFVAFGSGTMSNRLQYPIDFGEVEYNLPIMDVFINGKHFPLTTAAYVFRPVYSPGVQCPSDVVGSRHGPEFARCLRQQNEWQNGTPTFYSLAVNGTQQYNESGNFDLLRNNWDTGHNVTPSEQSLLADDVPPGALRSHIGWQWQPQTGTGDSFDFGSDDAPNYPVLDTSGSLREQVVYYASQLPYEQLMPILRNPALQPFMINPSLDGRSGYVLSLTEALNRARPQFAQSSSCGLGPLCLTRSPGAGNITGFAVLDSQMGDIDPAYDPQTSPGPQPGLMQQMAIYSFVKPPGANNTGTYLQIKEGKLYNPETSAYVRSVSSRDHVDLVSRMIQLSNNTQRFCVGNTRVEFLADQGTAANPMPNPVEACGNCHGSNNITKTCFDPGSRILFVRTTIGDTTVRKWFTDITQGL